MAKVLRCGPTASADELDAEVAKPRPGMQQLAPVEDALGDGAEPGQMTAAEEAMQAAEEAGEKVKLYSNKTSSAREPLERRPLAKGLRDPGEPTEAERIRHNLSHTPVSWGDQT